MDKKVLKNEGDAEVVTHTKTTRIDEKRKILKLRNDSKVKDYRRRKE